MLSRIGTLNVKLILVIGAVLVVFMTADMLSTIENNRKTALKEIERWSLLLAETVRVSMNTLMKEEKMDARFEMFEAIRMEIKGLQSVHVIRGPKVDELFRQTHEQVDIPLEQEAIDSLTQKISELSTELEATTDPLERKDIESDISRAKEEIAESKKRITDLRTVKSDPRERPATPLDHQVLSTGKPIFLAKGDTLQVWAPYTARPTCGEASGCHAGVRDGDVLGAVHMQFSLAQINKDMRNDAIVSAIRKMILGLTIIGCLVLMIHWVVIRNIHIIHAALKRFANGDFTAHIAVRGKDEVQDLAQGINNFISRFVEMLRQIRQEQQSAEENAERLQVVFDNANEGIMTVSPEGKLENLNAAAENIFGYSRDEALGKDVKLLMPEFEGGSTGRRESFGQHKDGDQFPIEIATSEAHLNGVPQLVCIVHDITERKNAEKRLNQLANFDDLTGLPNRNLFRDRLTQAIIRADSSQSLIGLMFLDLDRFKTINDTLGHAAGDQLLRHVATVLGAVLRKSDTIARPATESANQGHDDSTVSRLGGDEFTIILEGIDKPEYVGVVAQKIIEAFSKHPIHLGGQEVHISTSIGIATYPFDAQDAETLIRYADRAMYLSKEAGRNSYHFFTKELTGRVNNRVRLEAELRHAIEREEFVLYYQPKIDVDTNLIVGVEALIRWPKPGQGVVAPDEFIPLLEDTGLILPVGEWVLRTACAQALDWQRQLSRPLHIAVNLSARQFAQKDLAVIVADILEQTGLAPGLLELELTESMLMANTVTTLATMSALKDLGVSIAIDDFGTGYSSLSYLRRFPIHTLKIDRSFVKDITTEPDDAAIASTVVAMAKNLRLTVVAEGVEVEDQLRLLRRMGCHQAQGYLLGRPMPAEAFTELIQNKAAPADISLYDESAARSQHARRD